jgi:hypothetical protein
MEKLPGGKARITVSVSDPGEVLRWALASAPTRGSWPPSAVVRMAREVAECLSAVHDVPSVRRAAGVSCSYGEIRDGHARVIATTFIGSPIVDVHDGCGRTSNTARRTLKGNYGKCSTMTATKARCARSR